MNPSKLTPEQHRQMREDFLAIRGKLIAEGKTESEATMQAYEEVYKCRLETTDET